MRNKREKIIVCPDQNNEKFYQCKYFKKNR